MKNDNESSTRTDSLRFWSVAGLILAVILSVGLAAYHGYYKEYFYEDEVLSYTLSNSRHGAYFKLKPGESYNGKDLFAYTYVEKGHEFDFGNTVANQQEDTHPPVYALILHAVCSFDPGHFSKWAGLGINLFCMAVVIVLIWITALQLFPDQRLFAVAVCLMFGMTAGIVSLTVFIRMYMLLMIFTMLCLLWHIRAIRADAGIKMYVALSLLTYVGVMTHYFYLFFAFFCAAFFCIYLLIKKNFKSVLFYVGSMIAAAGLVLITWNKVIWQMFTEETAEDALSQSLTLRVICSKIYHMAKDADAELFGKKLIYIIAVVIIFAVYLVIKDRTRLKRAVLVRPETALTVFAGALFFVTVSAVTPYPSTRYVSPAYPVFVILAAFTLKQITDTAFRSSALGVAVIILFMITPELLILRSGLLDQNRQYISEISSDHEKDICLYGAGIPPEENVFELGKFDRIYVYDGRNASGAEEEIKNSDRITVYVPENTEPEEFVEDIRIINPDLKNLDRLYVAYYSTCYMLSK